MLEVILEPRMPTNFALISQQQMNLSPEALLKTRLCLEPPVWVHSLEAGGDKLLAKDLG